MPDRWRIETPQANVVANTRWWEQFRDPALDQLIGTALRENRDVLVAAARVDQFIGQLTATRSQFYPQFGYSLDASSNRASRVGQPPLAPGADPYYSLYQGALSAGWQIDLFGRVRRQSEAAQAQVYASEQGRRGVILTLVTSVATSYVSLRALDRQLEIARATAKNYGDTLRIFELRFKGGVVSEIELRQIESQYQQALAAIPSLELQVASVENLLSLLLGRQSGPIPRGLTIDQLVAPEIPGDLPSTLLERRPDILQAEQTLVAANANIGAARSLYFPTLSLTGLLGSVSTALDDFLTGPATAASIAAGLSGPIFTFGAISGQVDTAEAGQRAALAAYQQSVLNALRETNDALIGSVKKREEAEAQTKRVAALRDYARLSRLRFDNGYAGYLEVLYAENELFSAELTAVRSQAERYTQIVNVFQAVGGGWVDEAGKLAPQPLLAR
jgi:multidrug efflux system outer membrane protein